MLSVVNHRPAGPSHKHIPAGGKSAKNSTPPSAKEIVQMYRDHGNRLGVPEMRRYMKTMVAEVFLQDKFSAIHKCRGIWKQKPSDWDPNIPFADPNNAEDSQKSHRKPDKTTLKKMMSYLVKKFDESQHVKKLEALNLNAGSPVMQAVDEDYKKIIPAPPMQTTCNGNPWGQSSDWQQFETLAKQEGYNEVQYVQPAIAANIPMVEQNLSQPTMESHGAVEEGGVPIQEMESTLEWDPNMDLVAYLDGQQSEEVGGSDVNFNVQTKNESTDITRQVPCDNHVEFPPTMHQPPPPNNQMAGMPVSNAGELGGTLGSVFMGGEQGEEAAYQLLNGQTMPELFEELNQYGFDPNPIQTVSSDGLDMSYTTIMVENGQHSSMEESYSNLPMEETEQNIPLTVLEFAEDN